jgi:DNA-binding transcriptional LysR family regulator
MDQRLPVAERGFPQRSAGNGTPAAISQKTVGSPEFELQKESISRNIMFMRSFRPTLPPLNSLVAFEAVARHSSITLAADELRVSREAVSRQIRNLEAHVGARLFLRVHRAVELTKAGRALQGAVERGFDTIAEAGRQISRGAQDAIVSATSTIAIASFWLTPRLPRFRSRYPNVTLHVKVTDTPPDMVGQNIDVGLRYGDGNWRGLKSYRLFETDTFPVCSPAYLKSAGRPKRPQDLLQHTLLNLDGFAHVREDWAWFLEQCQLPEPPANRILGFDSYANVIQAAVDGQGIALGFGRLMNELLASGRLVRPMTITHKKGHAVHLVVPARRKLSANAQLFCDWIRQEAEAE